jgi:integrase
MSIQKRVLERPHTTTGKRVAYLVRVEGLRDPVTGKRRQYSKQVPTMKEAKALEASWAADLARGTALVPSKATVGDLLDEYLRIELPRTVRPENRQPYESIVNRHLRPALGNVLAQRLTVEHVEKLMADLLAAGYSPSLVTKVRMRLGSALKLGMRWGIVSTNVAASARPPKITYKSATIWTPDEIGAFLRAAETDTHWPLWLLLVETGARQSELLGVAWEDVDLDRGTLRIGRQVVRLLKGTPTLKDGGKSKAASRTIGLTPRTVAELRGWRTRWLQYRLAAGPEWNPADLLFTTASGTPLSVNNLRKVFERLVRRAGVSSITPHAIRKAAITYALANGASPKAVAARVGHADSRVTLDVYSTITSEMDARLLDIIAAIVPQTTVANTDGTSQPGIHIADQDKVHHER